MRENRAKVADYLIVDDDPGLGRFYIKNPRNTYDWTVFFQPLLEEAWIGLITFSFLVPIFIFIVVFFRKLLIISETIRYQFC